jgi:hypothetical protein
MKLTKHIRYLVRVRDYETVQVEVGAEADHHDLGLTDEQWTNLNAEHQHTYVDHLELLVINEVERLAADELQRIARWSEIEPNLAEDFLSSTQRSSNARTANKKADSSPSSRRIRRSPGGGNSPSAA